MGIHATNGIVVQRMVLTGLGIGVSMSLFTIVVQNAFPLSQMGAVTAALTFFRSIGGTIGVAILGSVMTNRFNSGFDANLPATLKQRIPPEQLAALKNPQLLLSHDATNKIHDSFAAFGAQSDVLFNQLMLALRQSLATAITSLFFAAMIAMVLAFVAVIFLKEIPLRKTNAPEAEVSAASAAAAALAKQPGPVAALAMDATERGVSPVASPVASPLGRPPGIPVPEYAITQPNAAVDTERIVAIEHMIQDQIEHMHAVSDNLSQRIAALERTIAALDQVVRSLPPAEWHRMQYARMGEWEHRIAALERVGVYRAGAQPHGDAAISPPARRLTYAD